MAGQPAGDQVERVARGHDRLHVPDGVERIRHRNQVRHFPPRFSSDCAASSVERMRAAAKA